MSRRINRRTHTQTTAKGFTQNGAKSLASSGNPLVDLYFQMIRGIEVDKLRTLLEASWSTPLEDTKDILDSSFSPEEAAKTMTLRCIFQARNIRQKGKGERKLFYDAYQWLLEKDQELGLALLHVIPFHGSWKDLAVMANFSSAAGTDDALWRATFSTCSDLFAKQLADDHTALGKDEDVERLSLASKGFPSEKCAHDKNGFYGQTCTRFFRLLSKDGYTGPKDKKAFRHMLGAIRAKVNAPERKMTAREWDEINYSKVPSKAGQLYKEVFEKHDGERYKKWQSDVKVFITRKAEALLNKDDLDDEGKTNDPKINVKVLMPYEMTRTYIHKHAEHGLKDLGRRLESCSTRKLKDKFLSTYLNPTVEAAWLQYYVESAAEITKSGKVPRCFPMVDCSGSMFNGESPQAVEVAVSIGLHLARFLEGPLNNRWMTFSETPAIHEFKTHYTDEDGKLHPTTLLEQVLSMNFVNWGGSTNLQAAFDLLLLTVLTATNTITDADERASLIAEYMPEYFLIISDMQFNSACHNALSNMEAIRVKFAAAHVKMPTLVFWNVGTIGSDSPVESDQSGVIMVSGFSPAVFEQISQINPKTLNSAQFIYSILSTPVYRSITSLRGKTESKAEVAISTSPM